MNKQNILKQTELSIQYILNEPDKSIKLLSDTLNVDPTNLKKELELLRQSIAERTNKPSFIKKIPLLIIPAIGSLIVLIYASDRLDSILSNTEKVSDDELVKQEVFSDVSVKIHKSTDKLEIQIETSNNVSDIIGVTASVSYLGLMLLQIVLFKRVISKLESVLQKKDELAPGQLHDILLIFELISHAMKLMTFTAFVIAVISLFIMESKEAKIIVFVNTLLGSLFAIIERYYESKLQFILEKIQWQMNVRSILKDPLKFIKELREGFKSIKEKVIIPDTIARYLNTVLK